MDHQLLLQQPDHQPQEVRFLSIWFHCSSNINICKYLFVMKVIITENQYKKIICEGASKNLTQKLQPGSILLSERRIQDYFEANQSPIPYTKVKSFTAD